MLKRRAFLKVAAGGLGALASLRAASAAEPRATVSAGETPTPTPPKIGPSSRVIDLRDLKPRRLTTASVKTCKLLQFTDLHFFRTTPADDEQTLADCRRHLERHQPDLVLVTGDLWQDNPEGKGAGFLEFASRSFSSWGVPWSMCWGNHDLLEDYQKGHDQLEAADHSLYCGGGTHGDYRLEVFARGAPESQGPVLDLFFLNSSDQGLSAWQARALRQMTTQVREARPAPKAAYLFFHMPVAEYKTRLGPDTFTGIKFEEAGSGKENGEAFPAIRDAHNIRACFCGRATGYAGYGGDKVRKGAKLIEIDLATGGYKQTTVFADGSRPFA
jgi:3',5'-cyclic AMP phosphodiesterase CpdA